MKAGKQKAGARRKAAAPDTGKGKGVMEKQFIINFCPACGYDVGGLSRILGKKAVFCISCGCRVGLVEAAVRTLDRMINTRPFE